VARYPSGILMYNAAGARPIEMFRWLSVDFVTELAEAILVVFLLNRTRLTTFGERTGFVLVTGILVAIGTNVSYWIWYGFVLKNQTLPATWRPRFLPGISRAILGP
jgi:hypothetical protein